MAQDFFVRYYVGHKGKYGHEFLEFEVNVCILCFALSFSLSRTHVHSRFSRTHTYTDPQGNGLLRYANHSGYRTGTQNEAGSTIKKEVYVNQVVLDELLRVIGQSTILTCDDAKWPEPDKVGRQELEIVAGKEHISFTTTKIGSLLDTQDSEDPEGLRIFYYLVQVCYARLCAHTRAHACLSTQTHPSTSSHTPQDLKSLVFSIMNLHFKIKPI